MLDTGSCRPGWLVAGLSGPRILEEREVRIDAGELDRQAAIAPLDAAALARFLGRVGAEADQGDDDSCLRSNLYRAPSHGHGDPYKLRNHHLVKYTSVKEVFIDRPPTP